MIQNSKLDWYRIAGILVWRSIPYSSRLFINKNVKNNILLRYRHIFSRVPVIILNATKIYQTDEFPINVFTDHDPDLTWISIC
jgi:hypothetical protein